MRTVRAYVCSCGLRARLQIGGLPPGAPESRTSGSAEGSPSSIRSAAPYAPLDEHHPTSSDGSALAPRSLWLRQGRIQTPHPIRRSDSSGGRCFVTLEALAAPRTSPIWPHRDCVDDPDRHDAVRGPGSKVPSAWADREHARV